jgi:starch synthase
VHSTGGLVDTVVDANPQSLADDTATGFRFDSYSLESLRNALLRAVNVYQTQPEVWKQIVQCGMEQDWSWRQSAGAYERVYQQVLTPALVTN